ncbi:FecR domain-containing protein [Halalkalibaculum sp. DA384]|uniref:FecR domain-containing protein n=1 Tax=Halalkalibaculum sp. DA384 TaxID=3373606 RepID=UPI00375502F2
MNWNLLHRYLTGECTPEQRQQVESWLESDPRNREFMNSLERIWSVEPAPETQVDARAAWEEFETRMVPVAVRQRPSRGGDYARMIAYGLSAAAVILVAFLFFQQVPAGEQSPPGPVATSQEIVTERGQRTTVRLGDGTRVQLNADSRLQIPGDYLQSGRQVRLQGEAYFEVEPDPDQPFLVHTQGTYTKVLGTKFGVRAYPEDARVQVVVTEGKVELGRPSGGIGARQLTRNQVGVLLAGGETRVSEQANLQPYLGWTEGRLVFEDTPFLEVRRQLERWYDIQITLADSTLGQRRLTASFSGEPMTEVLSIVALSTDMSYTRERRAVTFRDRSRYESDSESTGN